MSISSVARSCCQNSKTGSKTLPLGAPALAVFSGLPRDNQPPYVFPATRGTGHYKGTPKIWRNQLRDAAVLSGVRLHDLRHSFASVGVSLNQSLFIVGKILGHKRSPDDGEIQPSCARSCASRCRANIPTAGRCLKGAQDFKRGAVEACPEVNCRSTRLALGRAKPWDRTQARRVDSPTCGRHAEAQNDRSSS